MTTFETWSSVLLEGLVVTLQLAAAGGVLAVILAGIVAICSISSLRIVRYPARAYSNLFRSIPLLALLIFVFYGLGRYTADLEIPAFWLAVAALAINESAYLAEVFRAGLLAIPVGQWDAAGSLGLGWLSTVRLVILPQAALPAVPSTMNSLISLLKNSSLASLVTVYEVTLAAGTLVSRTFLPLQVFLALAACYLAVVIPLTLLSRRLERRLGKTSLAHDYAVLR